MDFSSTEVNLSGSDKTIAKFLANNVTIDFDMFGTFVKYQIFCNVEGRLINIIEAHGLGMRNL